MTLEILDVTTSQKMSQFPLTIWVRLTPTAYLPVVHKTSANENVFRQLNYFEIYGI